MQYSLLLLCLLGADGTFLHDGISALNETVRTALSVSVNVLTDLSFFDWRTGSARELGSSLLSEGHSVGTRGLAVCRIPDRMVGD